MDLSLVGRHALVGGASRGIGRASARALAALGAEVTCVARSEPALREVLESLPRDEGQAHAFLAADYSDPEGLARAVSERVQSGPVHILVHNTGGPPGGPAHKASVEEFRLAFEQHVICGQLLLQAVLPGMREAGFGRIINIISTSVKQPIPGLGVSNTIRGAVANWAKTLAGELGPDGITVNNVLPGATDTDRLNQLIDGLAEREGDRKAVVRAMHQSIPLRRFARASEIGQAVAFLASPAAGYINGINLPVDGGRTDCL